LLLYSFTQSPSFFGCMLLMVVVLFAASRSSAAGWLIRSADSPGTLTAAQKTTLVPKSAIGSTSANLIKVHQES
jgi:hypothetical protein